ncbi:hypothetical protein VTJ04DRAFT_7549 [Mycothermus thermophilus]|uniref:uncharacterized protein n=1 Tax=Humicola insolens TaxID=85995 RepID=UPI003743BCF4
MSRIFRSRRFSPAKPQVDPSGYSSLLSPASPLADHNHNCKQTQDNLTLSPNNLGQDEEETPETGSNPYNTHNSRPWRSLAESRPSSGDRPPPRKLVKDRDSHMNGAGRPLFSVELSSGEEDEEYAQDSSSDPEGGGIVRRQLKRLKRGLSRREK